MTATEQGINERREWETDQRRIRNAGFWDYTSADGEALAKRLAESKDVSPVTATRGGGE